MSRPTFVRAGAAVIAVAAATSLAACGGGGGGGGSQSASDTLTIGLNADAAPGGYDPQLYSAGQFQFFSSMYDALFVTNTEGEVVPSLVEKAENNADNTQLTLTLKDGVDLHRRLDARLDAGQGQPRPPQRGQRRAADQGNSRSGGLERDHRRRRARPQTVVITWAKPQARGQNALADEAGAIVGADAVADPTTLEKTPDGSGPYTLNEGKTTRASSYTVDKNDKSWNADAFPYETVVYKVITDRQALANAVVSGQVDVGGALDSTTVDLVKSKQSVVSSGGTIVGFPVLDKTGATNPAFANVKAPAGARLRHRPRGHREGPAPGVPRDRPALPQGLAGLRPGAGRGVRLRPGQGQAAPGRGGLPERLRDRHHRPGPADRGPDRRPGPVEEDRRHAELHDGDLHRPALRRREHRPARLRAVRGGTAAGRLRGGCRRRRLHERRRRPTTRSSRAPWARRSGPPVPTRRPR